MQALILSILTFLSPCSDDFLTCGERCFISRNLLANDSVKGHINKIQVAGTVYTVKNDVRIIMLDTGVLNIDKFGLLTFAPYNGFKGELILRYWIGKDWAYVKINVVQMEPVLSKPYCYRKTKGNAQIYYLLVRKTYLGREYYYYDTGLIMYPLTYLEWSTWYRQKITMP